MTDKNSTAIIDREYTSIQGFQASFYKGKDIESRFQPQNRKIAWNANPDIRLESSALNNGVHEFPIDKKQFHFLTGMYMIAKIPTIKVKSKYRSTTKISFGNNLLHHIHGVGSISMGGKNVHNLDPYILDSDRISRINDIIQYDDDIGNREELTDWNTKISYKTPLFFYPPWFFNINKNTPLPLYDKCIEKNKILFYYNFNLKLKKLLKMKRLKNKASDEWVNIDFNSIYLESVPDIPIPEIWGEYNYITKEELKERNEIEENIINYVDKCTILDDQIKKSGDTISINVKCTSPVIGMTWMAQNLKAKEYNNFSNYTTDSDNLHNGINPSTFSEILYETSHKVKEREHYHFDRIKPKRYFGHTPIENGYNFYMFDNNPLSIKVGNSVNLNGAGVSPVTINCKIEKIKKNDDDDSENDDSDQEILYPDDIEIENTNKNEYKYIVILYTLKRLIFNNKIMKMFYIADDIMYENYKEMINTP